MKQRSDAQWMVAGTITAPIAAVWKELIAISPGLSPAEKSILTYNDPPPHFTTTVGKSGEGRIHIAVNTPQRSIVVEGEWWYRGMYTVEPHVLGSLLRYRVYNIAPGVGWWAAQLVQGPAHARAMPGQFQQLLTTIGNNLGAATHLVSRLTK
jgi:hypothetical protein